MIVTTATRIAATPIASGYGHGRVDQRRFDRGRYFAPRGYHVTHWRHGDHLPRAYYSSRYIVRDYHAYHLSPPPHGHHWVRVNNDVILAAVASGLVVERRQRLVLLT